MTQEEIKQRLSELRAAHRALDNRINEHAADATVSLENLREMKKTKLQIKDKITILESMVIPDIIA